MDHGKIAAVIRRTIYASESALLVNLSVFYLPSQAVDLAFEPSDRAASRVAMALAELKIGYAEAGNPVFSMDSKAREHLGQLYRAGRVYTQRPFKAFDHDYPSWATGVLIPHGIYDLARNRGHINIGLSHDTSEFACDSFRWYWKAHEMLRAGIRLRLCSLTATSHRAIICLQGGM